MTFDQLSLILTIADTGSSSKAAERIYISQPSVSKTLKLVEDELGFPIFYRSKKGMTVTPQGKPFLIYAQETLKKYQVLRASGNSISNPGGRSLSVLSTGLDIFKYVFIKTLNEHEMNLDVMRHIVFNLSTCYASVLSGSWEMAVVHFPDIEEAQTVEYIRAGGLEVRELGHLDLNVKMSNESALARFDGKIISKEHLEPYVPSFPNEENRVFRRLMERSAVALTPNEDIRFAQLYGEDEYHMISNSRIPPEMYGTQVFVYSDWIQHVYDPNEFRCTAYTTEIIRKLGKKSDSTAGFSSFRISNQPFRYGVYAFWKSDHALSEIETSYINHLKEILDMSNN